VLSPNNRFVGGFQKGIVNNAPREICVYARENWWGSERGPNDPSSLEDACGLVDNPGGGVDASDGVDYAPWQGGVARPIIAHPPCGVTARSRPTFVGRSQAGATIRFYDDGEFFGETIAEVDHSFRWTPVTDLDDGPHIITAQATLDAEISLLSQTLPITIDSGLAFDPAGVRIGYEFHGIPQTQYMRDANGCATANGDLDTPMWVRPGSTITITVPFRDSAMETTGAGAQLVDSLTTSVTKPQFLAGSESVEDNDNKITLTYSSTVDAAITHYRIGYDMMDGTEVAYGPSRPLDSPLDLDNPQQIVTLPADVGNSRRFHLLAESRPGVAVARLDDAPTGILSLSPNWKVVPKPTGAVLFENQTGHNMDRGFVVWPGDENDKVQYRGASFLDMPLQHNQSKTIQIPRTQRNHYWLVLQDEQSTIYPRDFQFGSTGTLSEIPFLETKPGGKVVLKVDKDTPQIFGLYLHRHKIGQRPAEEDARKGLDLLRFFEMEYLNPEEEFSVLLERTNDTWVYTLFATDATGEVVTTLRNINSTDRPSLHTLKKDCEPPAKAVKVPASPGAPTFETLFKPVLPKTGRIPEQDNSFTDYYANLPQFPGKMFMVLCILEEQSEGSVEEEVPLGEELIDPDGYVYDAELGIEAVIEGAVVTCDQYDEDLGSWFRWPAELYESQINPQITAADGYYAFFVPAGLYRVRAQADGYEPHTSPNIRVIREIVHYNVPMQRPYVYLPVIEK
jgi:hypothetical protein